MKNVLLLIGSLWAFSVSATTKDDMQALIQFFGYRCDTVDAVTPFLIGVGFTVYCNGFQYHYEITDVGGRLHVEVK